MRRVLPAVLLVLVFAGCGSNSSIRTVTALPGPAPLPPRASAACKAAQLRPDWQGRSPDAVFRSAGGTLIGSFALRNAGPARCSLGQGLSVRLEPALVLQTTPPAAPPAGGAAAAAWLRSLSGNREAGVSLQWANWCVKGKRPARLRVILPDSGGSLTLAVPASLPKCYEISAPTTVSAAVAPVLRRMSGGPGSVARARLLPSAGSAPEAKLRARPGGLLRYRVELTNTASDALPTGSGSCSNGMAQQLAGGAPDVRRFDCAPLAGLKPGRSVIYDMALRIPPSTLPGPHVLEWVLNPYSGQAPAASAAVTIAG